MPDDLSPRRSAGFARDDGAQLCRVQAFRERLDLRGFAGPLATLEGDKSPAPGDSFNRCFTHRQDFSTPNRHIPITSSLAPPLPPHISPPLPPPSAPSHPPPP